jgi:hypothetical protein
MLVVNNITTCLNLLFVFCLCAISLSAQEGQQAQDQQDQRTCASGDWTCTVTCESGQTITCYPDGTVFYSGCAGKGNLEGDELAAFTLSKIFRRPVSLGEARKPENRNLLRQGTGKWVDPKGNVVTFRIPRKWLSDMFRNERLEEIFPDDFKVNPPQPSRIPNSPTAPAPKPRE